MSARLPAPSFPVGRRVALGLTLGLHLLAAFLWLQERRQRLAEMPRVVSILLQPPAPVRAAPVLPPPPPPPPPSPRPAQVPIPAAPAVSVPAVTPAVSALPAAPTAAPAEPAAADARPEPAPEASAASFSLDQARRDAGRIDRDLRKGKPGVPLQADTPLARLRNQLEQAHAEPFTGVRQESYTQPDGVVIYRKHAGGRTFCRRSGSVGLGFAGTRGVDEAGDVPCPKGVAWQP